MRTHLSFGVSCYIRQNRNLQKDYGVFCCIRVGDSVPRELSLKNKIGKSSWDTGKGRPKPLNDSLAKLSLHLDQVKARLLQIFLDLQLSDCMATAAKVKDIYLGRDNPSCTLLQVIFNAISKYCHEIVQGSLKNYQATRSYVAAYCKVKYRSGDIGLNRLNYAFIDDLHTYILTHPLKNYDPCTHNGCMKHMERLKKILLWAYEMRFIDRNVFGSFKIKRQRHEAEFLNLDQLKKLATVRLQRPILRLVRYLFLFCCYTGMAPCDMQHLQSNQISSGPEGLGWLTYTRTKSKVPAYVPLLNQAVDLITRYRLRKRDDARKTEFPFVSNKTLNDSLKIIGEICQIKMPLNFYMARHTFGTTVTLLHGVPISSIKVMMGHQKLESTMIYARACHSVVGMDMKLVQEKMREGSN
jgi:integrase/recombinase XerD